MKKGEMKCCLNSITNTLQTGDNLLMCGKATNDKCKQCKGRETTCHVLNNCPVSLEQGRYTWRHNNVINYILSCQLPVICLPTQHLMGFCPNWDLRDSPKTRCQNTGQEEQTLQYLWTNLPPGTKHQDKKPAKKWFSDWHRSIQANPYLL